MTNEEILANAPEGATHITDNNVYLKVYGNHCHVYNSLHVWSIPITNIEDVFMHNNPRLLSNIRRIVELEQKLEAAERERNEAHNELLAVFAMSTVSQSNESFDYGRRLLNKFAIEQKIEELEQFLEHLKWNFTWSHAVYGFINERINQLRQQLNGDSQ